ncbi:MFS transporter [Planctomicrobium piriforme]|uniref:Predicted arabinose efflux permease, MFS family n=1 Tax=Planctomicrobium piriforme TaxID=1576369 RepID=A0A1I3GNJ9_9PLAN|nr:MFS transporter [Planctomicrobium piriforme]SFI25047.1 Predicted arabinose efflux permease, MFS family [Planctomicrobium piriforme]
MSQLPEHDDGEPSPSIYNSTFWLAFTANLLLVTANAMTFRFAEFVTFLGGTEELTGQVISIGLVGSLVWRLFLGQAMDRFGVRRIWVLSSVAYVIGSAMIMCSHSVGWQLFSGRVLFAIGMASMFSAALSHVQSLAPPNRRTEIIGSYGTAGFLGMITGAQLGDLIFQNMPEGSNLYYVLFGLTTLLGAGHGVLAIVMTQGMQHERPDVTPAVHHLFLRYWPPLVLLVSVMMGLVFAVTTIFLTRYATHLGLEGIRTFFSAYAITAFLLRLVTRQWSRTAGRHRLIVYGLASHSLGQGALLFVTQEWQFIPAALCFGFGHALLFPSVVSLGAGAFPEQYRGTGTTLCLAAIDLGTMITAPAIGWTIDHYGFRAMLATVCIVVGVSTVYYAVATRGIVDEDTATPVRRNKPRSNSTIIASTRAAKTPPTTPATIRPATAKAS